MDQNTLCITRRRDIIAAAAAAAAPSRRFEDISLIVIHHSGNNNDTIDSIYRYHTQVKSWETIGYHYVIEKDGRVVSTNKHTTLSYHCKGYNKRSLGICLLGDYTSAVPPPPQLAALEKLLSILKDEITISAVVPHRLFRNTICPGDFLTNWINKNYEIK